MRQIGDDPGTRVGCHRLGPQGLQPIQRDAVDLNPQQSAPVACKPVDAAIGGQYRPVEIDPAALQSQSVAVEIGTQRRRCKRQAKAGQSRQIESAGTGAEIRFEGGDSAGALFAETIAD